MANERKARAGGTAVTDQEALDFHSQGRPGKLEITPTKPMATQRDLSLAYSPGVAVPVKAIAADPATAYDYTTRGNMVAVISNGTAILGLGNLGALASKPVMEGKSVLFKRFADVDSIDLEVDTEDADTFINCVRYLGPSFGGINLEDIKAPECFIIEQKLREIMDIPVFHDDQHGTAIIATAGLINALELTGRDLKTTRLVCNGAGAAAIACVELIKSLGFAPENIIMCDTKGVIYQGRTEGMNQWKSAHATKTDRRTLEEAMDGADVVLGLSQKGAFSEGMIRSMAPRPIIFAMANPDPEITPEEVASIRDDAIMATGRSDYPNQVNNVLCFPYMFRGALDVRATTINEDMKIAAARALASLAKEDVPDDVAAAYQGNRPRFGPQYIIPVPFDPRLISSIPVAVAKAAMESGVAQKPIADLAAYGHQREGFLFRDAQRLINHDRNHFAACMVALGDADGMVTGITRNYSTALDDVRRCIDAKPGHRVIGVSIALCRGRTVLVADTAVHDMPSSEELADIAVEAAGLARRLGYVPRVAMLAYSTFGHPHGERSERVREAVKILDRRRVDFEYDGEMAADVALNMKAMEQYPFCRLSGPATVLVMPAFHSASISTKMLQELGGATIIGPLLVGLDKSVQIVSLTAKDSEIVNMAALAAYNAG